MPRSTQSGARLARAFTLIELLIVVAIIAILAAIAVPNFLEAQVRSKVTRVKADQRTVATALEAYCVDSNHYPDEVSLTVGGYLSTISLNDLTTPIAYLTSNDAVTDPFTKQIVANVAGFGKGQPMLYANYMQFGENRNLGSPPLRFRAWALDSFGPDQQLGRGAPNTGTGLFGPFAEFNDGSFFNSGSGFGTKSDLILDIYDPTNGTLSRGDIYRVGGQAPSASAVIMQR